MEVDFNNTVIEKVRDVSEIQNYLNKIFEKNKQVESKDILFLIDIDQTIIFYPDKRIRRKNFSKYAKEIDSVISSFKSKYNYIFKYNSLLASCVYDKEFQLSDIKWPNFINSHLKKGNHVIAFTACIGGKIHNIKNFKEYRYNWLKGHNIVFDNSFNNLYKGMLIAEVDTKGNVLSKFLDSIKNVYNPKVVIFIDDSVNNLKSCALALKNLNVKYYPIQYEDDREVASDYDNEEEFKKLLADAKEIAEDCSPDGVEK